MAPHIKLNKTKMTGVSFNWHFTQQKETEAENKIEPSAKYITDEFNIWFIRLVNYLHDRVRFHNESTDSLFESAKKFRLEWLTRKKVKASVSCN